MLNHNSGREHELDIMRNPKPQNHDADHRDAVFRSRASHGKTLNRRACGEYECDGEDVAFSFWDGDQVLVDEYAGMECVIESCDDDDEDEREDGNTPFAHWSDGRVLGKLRVGWFC